MKNIIKLITLIGVVGISFHSFAADNKFEQTPVVGSYLHLQTKLASDQLLSKEDLNDFKSKALLARSSELMNAIDKLKAKSDIKQQREAFKSISLHVIAYAKKEKINGLYEANCPMASASWLQSSAAVKNPYYGAKMLTCGSADKI